MFILCTLGVVLLFIASQRVSHNTSILSALLHFAFAYYALYSGKKRLVKLRSSTRDPRRAQQDRLTAILTKNKYTAYAIEHELDEIKSLKEFQSKHPLTHYDRYETFVDKLAKGGTNDMTAERTTRLVTTSGTTGEGKLIPKNTMEYLNDYSVMTAIFTESFPNYRPMQKTFRLHCNAEQSRTKGGRLSIAPGMVIEKRMLPYMVSFSTPAHGFLIETIHDAFYVHFLFALKEREVGMTLAPFISMIVEGFKYLNQHWSKMVTDIQNGTINDSVKLPSEIRKNLVRLMGNGDSQRAEEVRQECEKGQQGIMKRLWPNMTHVTAIDNLGIRNQLMETIGRGIPFYSPMYTSAEGTMAYNVDPLQEGNEEYLLTIDHIVYEFIPEDEIDASNPKTYFVDEIQVGRKYEVVITQISGLYRYRLGDVIQVTGFYNNCPKIKFHHRTGAMLSIFGEKVDQVTIADSLNSALTIWPKIEIAFYCTAESTLVSKLPNIEKDSAARYIFFMEIKTDVTCGTIDSNKLAKEIDENIRSRHNHYEYKQTKQIATCIVYLVEVGTFEKLKAFILNNTTASVVQFKMPQKLRTAEMVQIMLENVL
ncbi:putative indole-3-acetic acid-amido synthetase GH3.9 [Apostichopus japonicus]|uniref:Putative indole-3-acetic acid-amido synthetase GH3.9 n=1 Tax=Stichopus japonicus TaxID=307972 RepID=A0A2G8KBA5_STIJA|nr:putative indole-3-acetic acid-amido synthetase GH3.9 [Apostichopus japonicus]